MPAAVGDVRVRIIKPRGATGMLPVIVYMHGGGWILGNAATHDRLVRELAVGARAALAFVEYPNSPEARYPVAIEQGYATAQWITREGASKGLDASRMAVAGESVGGNMTAALTLMAKERGDVTVRAARRCTTRSPTRRWTPPPTTSSPTALPHPQGDGVVLGRLHHRPGSSAPRSRHRRTRPRIEQLRGLPPTLLLVDEADVLRDEGEAYAAKLRLAGVPVTTVRYDGTIHDFMLLNALSETRATRAAIAQATAFLREALGTD